MNNRRLQQLAGISPLFEDDEGLQTITANGFRLEQEKNFEDDSWYIVHNVFKNQNHVATLDHNPRQWIDEKTFNKYVEFYQKHGRFPNRDDVRTSQQVGSSLTNQQIQTLKEDTDNEHFRQEQQVFSSTTRQLRNLEQFLQQQSGDEYRDLEKQTANLINGLNDHLNRY